MKVLTALATIALGIGSVFGQGLTVKYDIAMSSDNPQVQPQLAMMSGSTFTMYNNGDQSRTVMNMGGMMKTTTIIDLKKDKGLMLMDGMMGKIAIKLDSINEGNEKASKDAPEIKLYDDTKEILGYTCKKAIATSEKKGQEVKITYWYTEKIQPKAGTMGKNVVKGLPGLPLKYTMNMSKITMDFTATSVEKKIENADQKFDLTVPDGYTVKSMDDLKSMGM